MSDVDHRATSVISKLEMKTTRKSIVKEIFDKSTYHPDSFIQSVLMGNWGDFYGQNCGEGMYTSLVRIIEKALNQNISKKKVFIRNDKSSLLIHEKWVNAATKKIYDQIAPDINPNDKNYQLNQNKLLESLNSDKMNEQIEFFRNLTSEKDKWNFINEARNSQRTKTHISSLRNSFGDLITDPKRIANLLNYRFSKLGDYAGKKIPYKKPNNRIPERQSLFSFKPISIFDIKKHINNLNSNKPICPSKIPAWALKDVLNVIAEPLCYLVNTFIQEGKFPNQLKQAFVVPIFKKGDPENANNYRPISITSALGKLFEKILRQQINEYLAENNLLSQLQFGFRSNYSTTDALLFATESIRQSLDQNQFVATALLDLSKAFDSISHGILFEKLEELNFDSNALSLMKSYLTERYQKVPSQIAALNGSNYIRVFLKGLFLNLFSSTFM